MNHTRKLLLTTFIAPLSAALLLVILFETDILPCGACATDTTAQFVAAIIMELVTICVIPLALKLFRIKAVAAHITDEKSLLTYGTIRSSMLTIPLVANTFLYYMFMSATFGYMAVILLLCLAFVWPTKDRCASEAGATSDASN